jgi:cysteine-rich repeat protein
VRLAPLALVTTLVLVGACGRTTLGSGLLDSNGADDDTGDGSDDGDDDGSSSGGRAAGGSANGGVGASGIGGTVSGGNGGDFSGGSAGQLTGGSGGASSGGTAGMAGMSARCGDGIVGPDEACDPGDNPAPPALELRQGALRVSATPLVGPASANAYYDYYSRSAHTGLETVGWSRIFLYRWRPEAAMSLVMIHGIDEDSSGITQEDASVSFRFEGLPSTGVVALSDDDVELARTTPSTARGDWNFRRNTDGGVIGGLPFPGTWHLTVTPELFRSITEWTFLMGDVGDLSVGSEFALDLTQPVEIVSSDVPATCRADCTIPRCGDFHLDPGEVCDDGNAQAGDGCNGCQPEL